MPPSRASVTSPAVRLEGVLPSRLAEGALWLDRLRRSGTLAAVGDRLRVVRKPGYAAVDAFVFLLLYFTARPERGGLRGFGEMYAEWAGALGALAGRSRLMSASALSRLLDVARVDDLRAVGRWMLLEASGAIEVLRSPAVQARDARGDAWHVFDYDPTREAFRRRDLARGRDRPDAVRRTAVLASPGHRGRKRGEVVLTQGMLTHAGAGVWLDATVRAGNGDVRDQLGSALAATVETCAALGHPVGRALVRSDGEYGTVPAITAAKEAGVAFLTRLSRYELLDVPEVRARLLDARWEEVPDCDAGPRRVAANLGMVALPPGEHTLRADGGRYEPVEVRVVVSRYAHAGERRPGERGHRIGDGVYEMFGSVGLDPEAWPAAEVVDGYYRRCGQENRFAQADRELGTDAACSFEPGGHLLALLCALFVWNSRIVEGVRRSPPLPVSIQAPRAPTVVVAPAELGVGAPHAETPVGPEPRELPPAPPVPAPAETTSGRPASPALDVDALAEVLVDASFDELLRRRRPGAAWNPTHPDVLAFDGLRYLLITADTKGGTHGELRFAAKLETGERRQLGISVAATIAARVHAIFVLARGGRVRRTNFEASAATKVRERPRIHPERWLAPPAGEKSGPFRVEWSRFLPAEARRSAIAAVNGHAVHICADLPPAPIAGAHSLVGALRPALHTARQTWAQRIERYAAPDGTKATLTTATRRPTIEILAFQ